MEITFNNKKINIDIRDLVRLHIEEIGTLVGSVEAISKDYISLKNIMVIEPVDESTLLFQGSILFYSDEINSISVIGGKCDVKPLKQAN